MRSLTIQFALTSLLAFLSSESFATDIGGTITTNVTLTSTDSPYYLTQDYIVPDGFTLTIEPGVEIIINGYTRDIIVEGTIVAEGNIANHISIYSESGNGGGSLVLKTSTNAHSILYCDFENLGSIGASGFDTAIRIDETQLSMDHCTFTNCGLDGTEHLIAFPASLGNIGPNNSLGRVKLLSDTLVDMCTWPKMDPSGITYRLAGDIVVSESATLNIEAGSVVELHSYTTDLIIVGTLNALGTQNDSIHFISTTNNGGGSVVLRSSANSHSILYCNFEELGRNGASSFDTAIKIEDTALNMNHCRFSNCGAGGIQNLVAYPYSLSSIGADNDIDRVKLLSDTIESNCTWPNIDPAGFSYQIAGDIIVLEGFTLELDAGIIVDFLQYTTDLKIEGTLLAIGNPTDSIMFVSAALNGGGSLVLQSGGNAILEYMDFSDLGRISASGYDSGITLTDASLQMDHCRFTNSGTGGTRHIKAHASSLSDIGHNNSIQKIFLFGNSLTSSCTWPKADPSGVIFELESDITLFAGDQLTIEPGVQVEFKSYTTDLFIEGSLIALGSVSDSIRLFSNDTNGGGSLVLLDGSTAQLAYLQFEDLGRISATAFDTGLCIESASTIADNLSFENCGAGSVRHITAYQDVLTNFGQNNSVADILILDVAADVDATWPLLSPTGSRYVVSGDLSVSQGSTLEIEAGNVVLINSYLVDLTIDGTLKAIGTAEDSIRFVGQGSNGGGSLVFSLTSSSNELRYCSTKRLGYISSSAFDAAISTETGDLILEKSVIRNSRYGIDVISGQPTIQNNIIKDNSLYGLRNNSGNASVVACDNYWGDPSGPYNAVNNPTGLGNKISDNVVAIACAADALVVRCPNDTVIYIGDITPPSLLGEVEICLRDCGTSTSLFDDDIEFTQCTEDMTRIWTVTDTCGYEKTCQQTISWVDSISPTIICPSNVTLDCNQAPPFIDLDEVISMDNCFLPITETFESETETVFGCLHQFDRLFQVTDAAGNSSTCMTSYFVEVDLDPPAILNVPDDITVECDNVPSEPSLTTQDDCSSVTLDFAEQIEGDCPSMVTRTWTATDGCGNSTVATQVITVENPCPADINRDGTVDIQDFIQFNSAFGTLCTFCPEDINRDGSVDITDFIEFNSAFGSDCVDLLTPDDPLSLQQNDYNLSQEVSRLGMLNLNPDLEKLLHDIHAFLSLTLYPIPSNGESIGMLLTGIDSSSNHSVRYSIHDLTGKLIRTGSSVIFKDQEQGRIQFDKALEAGIYLLEIVVEDVLLSQKLIIE